MHQTVMTPMKRLTRMRQRMVLGTSLRSSPLPSP